MEFTVLTETLKQKNEFIIQMLKLCFNLIKGFYELPCYCLIS